jgi:hypothetical protein
LEQSMLLMKALILFMVILDFGERMVSIHLDTRQLQYHITTLEAIFTKFYRNCLRTQHSHYAERCNVIIQLQSFILTQFLHGELFCHVYEYLLHLHRLYSLEKVEKLYQQQVLIGQNQSALRSG